MRQLDKVKTLSESEKQLLRDLKAIIARFVPDSMVILYGSAARGEHGPESDYDVLVLTGSRVSSSEERLMDSAIYDMELDREVVLSVTLYSEADWRSPVVSQSPYHDNVTREGVVV